MVAENKRIKIGTWVQINSADIVECIAISGFDFAIYDMEHGNIDFLALEALMRAGEGKGLKSVVRVQENNPALIMRALDLGAAAILVPSVSSSVVASRAVEAAKYAPLGSRGACPFIRAGGYLVRDWSAYSEKANNETQLIVLIECKKGIENLEEIISTKGVDGFMIGPFDLSVSLGLPGQVGHPLIEDIFDESARLAVKHGKEFYGVDFQVNKEGVSEMLPRWRERGINTIVSGADKAVIMQGFSEISSFFNQ
jgi:4-hydroxy-2-oxoheptanedioate aldolase